MKGDASEESVGADTIRLPMYGGASIGFVGRQSAEGALAPSDEGAVERKRD